MNDSSSSRSATPDCPVEEPVVDVIVDEICDWLVDQALSEPALDELFSGCCRRIHAAGIPLARAMIGYSTLHPLYRSKTLNWTPDGELERIPHGYDSDNNDGWLNSPPRYMIENRVFLLRRRLIGSDAMVDFPVLEEFRDQGHTDYFAYLISFEGNEISESPAGILGSWGTRNGDGFSDAHLRALKKIQRQLAVAMKVRVKDEIAGNVLAAYLGSDAGSKVLQGRIRLGDGERIHAIVWYSDLRNSTRLAASMSHEAFLGLLNEYFECTAGAVLRNGGEVLRFVGDAVLAIFPVPEKGDIDEAGRNAIAAVREALRLGSDSREAARQIEFGIGLHVGDVLFGNIGVPSRVEFSVIGSCANEAARLEDLTKTLGCPVLVSEHLATGLAGVELVDLGAHALKGVDGPVRVFGLA